jgi:hypothetical protein
MPKGNLILVRDFLNKDTTKPVVLAELNAFWKSLTDEEKNQYADEVRKLCPELDGLPPVTA